MTDSPVLTTYETAAYLRISRRTVYETGELRSLKVGDA